MKRSLEAFTMTSTATVLESAVVNKPVFLTKAHREELALKRRQDEIASQRRPIVRITPSNGPEIDYRDRNRDDSDRDRERHRGGDGDRDRERKRERRNRDREREEEEMTKARAEVEREKEMNALKEQYLGSSKPKKRVMKPSEKRRFCFDWEKSEDTSRGQNPHHEAQLLFGRGFRAGIDRREQKNLAAKHERETHVDIPRREDTYQDLAMKVDKHWSEKKVEEMVERDWRIFKEDFNISYKGSKIPHPMRNWEESKLSHELLKAVKREKYENPTAIQMATIPLGLEQRDVIGIAQTGTGKTVAFVLPMLEYIAKLPPMSEENQTEGPYALVLVPTRELAQQIELETVSYARCFGFNVTSVVGGQSIQEQGLKLSQGCEIVIATPGRLLDCLERRYVVLNQCNYVVLDEADRMIDLGLESQVAEALEAMPSSNFKPEKEDEELDEKKIYRTTYMFSATMPHGVEKLAKRYLKNPVVVTVGNPGQVTDLVSQQVIMVKESEKFSKLRKLIDELGDDKAAIVFVNTKRKVDYLVKNLEKLGNCRVTTMHGGKSQEQRETSVQGFRSKRFNVIVATDVLARGFNELGLHVVNYDMADDMATYTHRVGRTGRAGEKGVATTFLTLDDKDLFYGLKQMLVDCNSLVPPELARHEASKFKPGTVLGRFSKRRR